MYQKRKLIVSILIAGVVIYVFARNVEPDRIVESLRRVDMFLALLAILLSFASFIVKVYRWQYIIGRVKAVPYADLLGIVSVSQLLTNILSFRAGDLFQVFALSIRERMSKIVIASTMAACYLLDFLSMAMVFSFISFAVVLPFEKRYVHALFVGCAVLVSLTVAYVVSGKRIEDFVSRHSTSLGRKIARLNAGFRVFSDKKLLAVTLASTLLMWIIGYVQTAVLLRAFACNSLSPAGILAYLVIPGLVNVIPVAQLALSMSAGWAVLIAFGVGKSTALCVALMAYVIGLGTIAVLALSSVIVNRDLRSFTRNAVRSGAPLAGEKAAAGKEGGFNG